MFTKLSNLLTRFIYGEIELKLQKLIDEIEKDKNRTIKLQEELTKSRLEKEAYKNLVTTIGDTIPDMMWAKDLDGKYIYVNNKILKGLFYKAHYKKIIGKTDIEITKMCKEKVGSENHTFGEICANSDKIVLETNKKGRFLEWGLVNGKDLYLEVYKAPLVDRDGKVEMELMKVLPKDHWILYNIQIIRLGREICKAPTPHCEKCFLKDVCKTNQAKRKAIK